MRKTLAVDVSHYQDKILTEQLIAGGVEMVIVKAAGGMAEDPKFRQHAEATLSAGLKLGLYFWDDPILSSERQVAFWLSLCNLYPGQITSIFMDAEQWWSVWGEWYKAVAQKMAWSLVHRFNPDKLAAHFRTTMELLRMQWSGRLAIYTNWGFVTSWAPKMSAWLVNFDLWVSHYKRQCPKGSSMTWEQFKADWLPGYEPLLPPGTTYAVGHQFTGDHAMLPGMIDAQGKRSPADVSLFDGNWLGSEQAEPMAGSVRCPKCGHVFISEGR